MRETFSRVYSNRYTVRRNGSSKFKDGLGKGRDPVGG